MERKQDKDMEDSCKKMARVTAQGLYRIKKQQVARKGESRESHRLESQRC